MKNDQFLTGTEKISIHMNAKGLTIWYNFGTRENPDFRWILDASNIFDSNGYTIGTGFVKKTKDLFHKTKYIVNTDVKLS